MTAKIKLNSASGGGSFSFQAPSSSSNNRVFTLPDTADGTILTTTNPKTGNIIQVQSATKTDVFTTTTAGFNDIPNMSVSITPNSSSNKILLHYDANVGSNEIVYVRLLRGSTAIGVGDASGNTLQVTQGGIFRTSNDDKVAIFSGSFLDTPSTTSATTYKLQLYLFSGTTAKVNAPKNNTDAAYTGRGISTITAMEVAG